MVYGLYGGGGADTSAIEADIDDLETAVGILEDCGSRWLQGAHFEYADGSPGVLSVVLDQDYGSIWVYNDSTGEGRQVRIESQIDTNVGGVTTTTSYNVYVAWNGDQTFDGSDFEILTSQTQPTSGSSGFDWVSGPQGQVTADGSTTLARFRDQGQGLFLRIALDWTTVDGSITGSASALDVSGQVLPGNAPVIFYLVSGSSDLRVRCYDDGTLLTLDRTNNSVGEMKQLPALADPTDDMTVEEVGSGSGELRVAGARVLR